MPASAAARATFTSGTAAPARSREPVLDLDVAEALPQADHHAADAAVAHEQIGAKPDDGDGDVRRRVRHEVGKIGLVCGRIENLGGTADAEPSDIGEHGAGLELAAQLRELRSEIAGEVARDLCVVHARLRGRRASAAAR